MRQWTGRCSGCQRADNLILTARRENILIKASKDISEKHKVKVDYIAADLSDIHAPEIIKI